jgi:hypothetical protein
MISVAFHYSKRSTLCTGSAVMAPAIQGLRALEPWASINGLPNTPVLVMLRLYCPPPSHTWVPAFILLLSCCCCCCLCSEKGLFHCRCARLTHCRCPSSRSPPAGCLGGS